MNDTTNIELARRFIVAYDAGDASVVDELVHPDHREHAGPDPGSGQEGVRASLAWLHEQFAEPHNTIEDLVAAGDRVVARVRFAATCTGDIQGVDAAGRSFETDHVHIWRVADGRLAEHWMVRDDLSMLRQLGIAEVMA